MGEQRCIALRPAWRGVAEFDAAYPLGLSSYASAEAQVAALADDIAYNNHDVDDGLQAGLFGIEDLVDIPLIGPSIASVRRDYPELDARMLRLEAVRVHEVLHNVLGICAGDVQQRGLRLDLDLAGSDEPVNADPARLQQVFWNLVKNAIKFTPAGGRITVRTRDDGAGHVRVEVQDTGVGSPGSR